MKSHIKIQYNWCKGCGICISLCPKTVLEPNHNGQPTIVNESNCIQCCMCEYHCPDFAIRIRREI